MNQELERALEGFPRNPGQHAQTLREILREDRAAFASDAMVALQRGHDTPGHKYLLTLLTQNGLLIDSLCNPLCFDKDTAIALARKITQIEPALDRQLARLLPDRNEINDADHAGEATERVLDLLEATSPGTRLVPLITHLRQCSNARVRARVALMIGRRLQNARSTEALLRETDARVRANAVEALFGVDTPAARALLLEALKDTNNRVVGNAVYGLYLLGHPSAIPEALRMAGDARPACRVSAAWMMAETGDPRFLPPLEKLAADLYAPVRKAAVEAIARVRRSEEDAAGTPRLSAHVLRAEKLANGSRSVWIRVENSEGEFVSGLPSKAYILSESGDLVIDYRVSEHCLSERLGVGFALSMEPGVTAEFMSAAEEAVSACLRYRRATDFWAVSKLFSDTRSTPFVWHGGKGPAAGESAELPRYLVSNTALKKAIAETANWTGSCPATLESVRRLLDGVGRVMAQRHLIILAGPETAAASDLHLVAMAATAKRVAIHAVVAGERQPVIEAFCRKTGGNAVAAPQAENVANAYRQIYLGLLNRYEIVYRPELKAVEEQPEADLAHVRIFSMSGCGACEASLQTLAVSR